MQLHCTRPGCSRPVNFHPNLEQSIQTAPQLFCTNCGMPLILSGRYLPERLLGQGGFGAAYYACDRYTPAQRPCVVKLFQPSSNLNPEQLRIAQQLFAREAEVLERLGNQHPQIPDLYAYFPIIVKSPTSGEDEEYFYLVQEFIDGEDLEQILERRGAFPEKSVKAILISILKVLEFVHDNSAIHRDIKPSNIMKTVDNQLFLLDFGAVKQVTGATASTRSTGIYTTGYAPPEQVTGGQVFPASDLYSLAVTCIVLLTGKETAELFDSYSNCWRWRQHVSLKDEALASVLDKLLSTSPQDRYASAQAALIPLITRSSQTVQQRPAPSPQPQPPQGQGFQTPSTSQQPKRNFSSPWILAVLLLLAAVALVGGGGWWARRRGLFASNRPSSQVIPFEPAERFTDVDIPPGQFTYGGSTTWAPIRGIVDPQLQKAIPSLQLTYRDPTNNRAPGSSVGIQMLIDGELDFAQTSRPLTSAEIQQAQQLGITLQEIPVAIEGVGVVVHPELTVADISQAELRAIYTGQLVNWQQLGGPDLPIIPVARNDTGGTVQFFSQSVLNGEALATNVQRSNSTTEAVRLTSNTPGAIYFASVPEVVGQCTVKPITIEQRPPYQPPYIDLQNCPSQRNQPNLSGFASGSYPLTRQIYVIANPDKPIGQAYAALLLSDEGQAALGLAGFAQLQ